MNDIRITVEEDLPREDGSFIVRSLVSYNGTRAAPENHRELAVVARGDGTIAGGLIGYTHWNWLYVRQLWVAENRRRCGIGGSLMAAAEREALARGCIHAHCDTFDFQALPFYLKSGYRVFGSLDDYPAGHTRYFLSKNLKPPESPEPSVRATP